MSIVRFENVSKQFSEDAYGINSVSFVIEPGEFMFVTGPSGSGKTTLMRLLLKEYDYTDGEIYFHDTPLSDIKDKHVHLHRRKIGVVFQDYKLIPEMNIWENIALPLSVMGKSMDEIERRVTDLLNLIKLPEKALQFPSQLSGGEAQRVGIARALAVGPELIIADEPTGNLDPETAQSIARLLKKINELGTTVVIATHDRSIIATFPKTRKLTLERGKVTADHKTTDSESSNVNTAPKTTKSNNSTVVKPEKTSATADETKISHGQPTEKKIAEEITTTPEVIITTTQISDSTPWWKRIFGKKKSASQSEDQTTSSANNSAMSVEVTISDLDLEEAPEKNSTDTQHSEHKPKKASKPQEQKNETNEDEKEEKNPSSKKEAKKVATKKQE